MKKSLQNFEKFALQNLDVKVTKGAGDDEKDQGSGGGTGSTPPPLV